MNGYRYSYVRKGSRHYIYDEGNKIAEVNAFGDEARAIAKDITYSLNMRDRYLKKKSDLPVEV